MRLLILMLASTIGGCSLWQEREVPAGITYEQVRELNDNLAREFQSAAVPRTVSMDEMRTAFIDAINTTNLAGRIVQAVEKYLREQQATMSVAEGMAGPQPIPPPSHVGY